MRADEAINWRLMVVLGLTVIASMTISGGENELENALKQFDRDVENKSEKVRIEAVNRISYFNGDTEVTASRLIKALSDLSPSVRTAAYNGLALGVSQSDSVMREVMKHAVREGVNEPTIAILRGLSTHLVKSKEGTQYILENLHSSSLDIRHAAWCGASLAAIENLKFSHTLIDDSKKMKFSNWDSVSRFDVLLKNRDLFSSIHSAYILFIYKEHKIAPSAEDALEKLYLQMKADDYEQRKLAVNELSKKGIDSAIFLSRKLSQKQSEEVPELKENIDRVIAKVAMSMIFIENE